MPSPLFYGTETSRYNGARFRDQPFLWDWQSWANNYAEWKLRYNGSIYRTRSEGGLLDAIYRDLTGLDCTDDEDKTTKIVAQVTTKPIVDPYQSCLSGSFGPGQELDLDEDAKGEPPSDALREAVTAIWADSRLDTNKEPYQYYLANYGTCLLRVVARYDPDPARRKATVRVEHPRRLKDYDTDADGHVVDVLLSYEILGGELGEKRRVIKVEERLTKTSFSLTYDGIEQLKGEQLVNRLGVCPIVVAMHARDDDSDRGLPAHYGAWQTIDWINLIATAQGWSVYDHGYPEWLAAGAGDPPTNFMLGRHYAKYVKLQQNDPTPFLQAIVPQLQQGEARQYWLALIAQLMQNFPEMVLADMKAISGLSGEAISNLLMPVKQLILKARARYEEQLWDALRIAQSWRILLGISDFGTGTGTAQAADAAFRRRLIHGSFKPREALPQTMWDQLKKVELETARRSKDLDDGGKLAKLGDAQAGLEMAVGEEEAARILERKRTTGVVPGEGETL
jgi:hypothetical protein